MLLSRCKFTCFAQHLQRICPRCSILSTDIICRSQPRSLVLPQESATFHTSACCRSKTKPRLTRQQKVELNSTQKIETTSLAAQMMLNKDAPGIIWTETMQDDYDMNELEALAQDIVNTPDLILEQSFDDDKDESDDLITSDVIPAKIPEGDTAFEMFGSPDPMVPMSNVPCAGCGANLHCQDPAIPGYLPSQKFTSIPMKKLRTSICQRCLLMKYHKIALNVSVHPEEYNKIISQIRNKGGLAIVVVDLLDMPNSIFKDLPELIGQDRPLYIIGNKVDLIPRDETGYLKRTKDMLMYLCKEAGLGTTNEVMHTALVSAKTGYGIEELITQLLKDWGKKGMLTDLIKSVVDSNNNIH